MTNHGCKFDWCENPSDKWESHRCEHFHTPEYIPATGNSLSRIGRGDRRPDNEDLPTLAVGVRFNEDIEPAPTIFLEASDAVIHVLRIDEAVLLYNALGQAIVKACEGTRLSPKRIASFYSGEDQ
ncbi:hypothetical protein [Mycobacterium avium]|uniref:hypothetical protein n=1 Tax=Mycobacterium avium TaxID=1764 RepID=UPI001CC351D3|nr:hypothetical protein [Mycobacterium avium]MBZ4620985.1 hypothetical protein [Mycobacterium avium subsp. hominissuis]